MLQNIIQRFSKSFKKYMLSYKQGFYIIPYLANSPEASIESFKNTPFVNWDEQRHLLTQKSFFMDGHFYYYKIEEGFWIFLSHVAYKTNIEYKMYFDDSLPSDYYLFSYNVIKHNSKQKIAIVNGLSYQTFSWSLFKPKCNFSSVNFKNTDTTSLGVYLSKHWVEANCQNFKGFGGSCFESFIKSNDTHTIWSELEINAIYQTVLQLFQNDNLEKHLVVKDTALSILNYLIQKYPTDHKKNIVQKIEATTHLKLKLVEKELKENLLKKFPGIDTLAKNIGMSPTKLKNDFKYYFGEPIYQYYLGKQMDYALILLRDKKMKVGSVAKLLGYQSEGKFTVAFKEKFGKLPSKVAALED